MKVTITRISRVQRISQKTSKPYTSMGIQTKEYGDQWLNGFGNPGNRDWKEGDTVEVNISKKERNGKEVLDFENPKPQPVDQLALISEIRSMKQDFGRMFTIINDKLDMIRGVSGDPEATDAAFDRSIAKRAARDEQAKQVEGIESTFEEPPAEAYEDVEWPK